jgi:glycosyltransferase involved in cell wall biosynthesis
MALVDIVIPAFNRPQLLEEAIASIRAQSFCNWRLFIVDDATPTALPETLKHNDARITLLRLQKNHGPAYARNYGAERGSAPLIAFLDSDDLWHPEKLSKALQAFERDPTLQWWHSNELWLRDGKPAKQKAIHQKQGGQFFERALERCLISPSAVVLRRSFFSAEKGFAPAFRLCEDYELWLRLLLLSPVGYSEEPLTIKRAGDWPQLSSARELDRYRVLAMHRVWRLKGRWMPANWQSALLKECEKRCELLLQGARKHENELGQKRYQLWLTLFRTLRTRLMR